ncbi:SpoIIE family protein phosphatase [Hamadaea tsunoensis]|uniref:SpoIIE family protein phosphatase n=1 Tax=Hamadaea tsunoensis TaxID=53368 RepID=UPI00041A0A88|nr:SpoIIE family protein phosphatase [Hamadaea tsunoensis]
MTESTAEDWAARVHRLEQEVVGMRRAMRTRGLIEQAKGILAERLHVDPEKAFAQLSERSQNTNTPLVDVAADIINTISPVDGPIPLAPAPAAPAPVESPESLADERQRPLAVLTGLAQRGKVSWPLPRTRLLRRGIAAMNAADDVPALAAALLGGLSAVEDTPSASGAALFATEPNGTLRLLGAAGWSTQQTADARRIPSLIATPMSEVARSAHPVLLDGLAEHDLTILGPGSAVAAYPIVTGSRVVGVLLFSWPDPREFGPLDRDYLDRLAKAAGRVLSRVWTIAVAGSPAALTGDLSWVSRVIEGTFGMTQLLVPIRDASGTVVDFTIGAMSPAALVDHPHALGRRLLDVYPSLVTNGVFEAYAQALASGQPWERGGQPEQVEIAGVWQRVVKTRRATPIGGALICSWQRLDEYSRLEQQVVGMEQLGRFGWCEWDSATKRMWWSPGLYELLGRDPKKGPLSRTALVEVAEPEYRPALADALRRAAHGGQSTVDVDVRRSNGSLTRLRILAAPDTSAVEDGDRAPVRLVAQDISDLRLLDDQLRRSQAQASAQRVRLAAEHELTRELMDLVYPARSFAQSVPGLKVVGRHYAADTAGPLRGDFCDVHVLPGDDLLVAIGDMFGSGMTAAAGVARLLPALPPLGIAGLPPEEILTILNAELHRTPEPPLASVGLARIDHTTRMMTWALAGHLPPILVRKGVATPLKAPGGPVLGLIPEALFTSGSAQLEPGDMVVFYTDGVLDRRAADPVKNLGNRLGRLVRAGEPESVFELPTSERTDEACLVAVSL